MNSSLQENRKKKIHFYLYLLFAIVSIVGCMVNSAKAGNKTFNIGKLPIQAQSLNGILMSLGFAFLILLILNDHKKGFIIGLVIDGIQFMGSIGAAVKLRIGTTIPGSVNCIIIAFSLIIINNQIMKIERAEVTDRVTNLGNRYGFEDYITKNVALWQKGYVAYVHIDGFMAINANLGRRYGDIVLKEVAKRITDVVGKEALVFKIEGAEYALVISPDCDCELLATKIIAAIEEKIILSRHGNSVPVYISAHIGYADYMNGDVGASELMRNADSALNHALKSKKTKIIKFNKQIFDDVMRQMEVENLIKDALANNYFYLVYQPQYNISDHKLRGFETLVRMKLPDGTVVSPAEFISVAEQSEMIMAIDDFVVNKALMEFAEICRNAKNEFTVSVNVSAKEISSKGYAEKIIALVEKYNFPPQCLEIEITEYSLSENMKFTEKNILALRKHNIKIALDDFGTGYTSLSQLLTLPVDLLKIDKSLVDNINESEVNRDFIKAVIYMGHLMNCKVISEGVEETERLDILGNLECDYVQGFVWGKPMEYNDAVSLL